MKSMLIYLAICTPGLVSPSRRIFRIGMEASLRSLQLDQDDDSNGAKSKSTVPTNMPTADVQIAKRLPKT